MALFDEMFDILKRRWGNPEWAAQRIAEWKRPIDTIRLTGDIGREFPTVWLAVESISGHASAQWKISDRESLNRAIARASAFSHSNEED